MLSFPTPDGTWCDPSEPPVPTHPLGSDRGGSSGYSTAKMCRNPVLEKDQPCGVSDTTQGIPKACSASLPRTNLGVVCRGSDKVSNFSRAMDQWVAEPGARQAPAAVPREAVGMAGGEPTFPQVLGCCWKDHGTWLGELLLPRWVMPFLPSGEAGTNLPCSHWTSHLVTGHKGACS